MSHNPKFLSKNKGKTTTPNSEKIIKTKVNMASFSNENSSSTWEKLAAELNDYGGKIDAAKSQFDDLSTNIDDFTRQLDEAAARERKITEMLASFMKKIDDVSQENYWDPNSSQRSTTTTTSSGSSPKRLTASPAWKSSPPSTLFSSSPTTTTTSTTSSSPSSSATAVVAPDSSPLRSSDLGSSTTNYISSREFGQDGPQVHISRHGSISIMAAPKQ